MREIFGPWGLELPDERFRRAVAGRLVELLHRQARAEGVASVGALAGTCAEDWDVSHWGHLRAGWAGSALSAEQLADAFVAIAGAGALGRLVAPDLELARGDDAAFGLAVLEHASRALGDASVVSALEPTADAAGWRWPLRVGVAPCAGEGEGEGEEVAAALAGALGQRAYARASVVGDEAVDADLLVVPGPLARALAWATTASRVRARIVLVTGSERGLEPRAVGPVLAAVRTLVGARASVLARLEPASSTSGREVLEPFLGRLVDEIGHDLPFDRAVAVAWSRPDDAARPLVLGELPFLDRARASVAIQEVGIKLASIREPLEGLPPLPTLPGMERLARVELELPEGLPAPPGMERRARADRDPPTTGWALAERPDEIEWGHETDGATGGAILSEALSEALRPLAEQAPLRWLYAGARGLVEGVASEALAHEVQAGRGYAIDVWIGPEGDEGLTLGVPFPGLPERTDDQELTVVLHEPRLLAEPQLRGLKLPPVGKSEPCRFLVHVPAGLERIEARIVVLHRGRVLQTGILRAEVVPAEGQPGPEHALRFVVDAAPRMRLQTLSARQPVDAALVANHDGEGKAQTLGVAGGRVARIKLGDAALEGLTGVFGEALSSIARDPDAYATLRSKGTVALLRELAQHGARLHEVIHQHNQVGPAVTEAKRLQIVTARVDGFLPLELAYAYDAPEPSAKLCKGAEEALAHGTCPAEVCGRRRGTETRLCPLGFWGLSKTIERFAHRPEHVDEPSDYALLAEPLAGRSALPRPTRGLLAASRRATVADKRAVERIKASMDRKLEATEVAEDWKAWEKALGRDHPELLVLLGHHVREGSTSALELGVDSRLPASLVKRKHVVGRPEPKQTTHPIVMLLGCETQGGEQALEQFPSMFGDRGAVMVVATIATILGQHASPAAITLVKELYKRSAAGKSLGELLMIVRRRLLLEGRAMGLALVGFGDADWQLQ